VATINSHYFRVCTRGARRQGVAVEPLLRAAGINPDQVADPLWRGSVAAMAALVREIWSALGDEGMGYTATRFRPGAFALMAELAASGDSVAQGIEKGVHFYNVLQGDIATTVSRQHDELVIETAFARPELDPDHYFIEFWLITWHRLACWLAGETVSLHGAEFNYPRPESYFEEFKYLFPCPHSFNAGQCLIRLDLGQVLGPVMRTKAELEEMLAHAPLELMTIPASDHSLARRVRLLLAKGDTPHPSLEDMAAATGLSVESFRRQLRREGTSLRGISQNLQRDIAIRNLLEGNRTVEDIAAQLGYAEPRSFTRAFRKWTGTSPSAYRRRFSRQ
jgi:AraC-like DNA-binding protein